jgi:hypothetical protein
MSRPTLDELDVVYRQAHMTCGHTTIEERRRASLAAVLKRVADEVEKWDTGHYAAKCLRAIAAEADPPAPDTQALKAAALTVRDEGEATMRSIKAMNAAMDIVLAALPGGKR